MIRTDDTKETPKTVDEVVEVMTAESSRDDLEALKRVDESELSGLHFSLGMAIGNRFVYPNEELKRSVALRSGRSMTDFEGDSVALVHADEVSERIIRALWRRLREDERP